ncbi:hypothetical protein D3C84_870870 [compost metagenome]
MASNMESKSLPLLLSVPKPTGIPRLSISATGATPLPNFMLQAGLCTTLDPLLAIRSSSSAVSHTPWARTLREFIKPSSSMYLAMGMP